ncbi:MAG: hypothetical protein U1F52_09570 [Burkholderiales bacterium]
MTDTPQTVTLASRPFVAFGQHVRRADTAVGAFVILHRRELTRARKALQKTRLELGIPATVRFDGAAAFDPATRAARGLGDLDDNAVRKAILRLIATVNAIPGMMRYTYMNLSHYPTSLDDPETGPQEREIVRQVLFARCFAVPTDGTHGPQGHETEPVLADKVDRGSYANAVLLDLADLVAEACARVVAAEPGSDEIRTMLETFQYWSNTEVLARAPAAAAS